MLHRPFSKKPTNPLRKFDGDTMVGGTTAGAAIGVGTGTEVTIGAGAIIAVAGDQVERLDE